MPNTTNNGFFGRAGSFNGNGYVEIPHDDSFNVGGGDFAISFWMNTDISTDDLDQSIILSKKEGFDPYINTVGFDLKLIKAVNTSFITLQFNEWDGTNVLTTPLLLGSTPVLTLNDGNWHHVYISRLRNYLGVSGSWTYIVVDGGVSTSGGNQSLPIDIDSNANLLLGGSANAYLEAGYVGLLDEFAMFKPNFERDNGLRIEYGLQIYNEGLGVEFDGCLASNLESVLYLQMNELEWTGQSDEIVDQSCFLNHGFSLGGITTTANGFFERGGDFTGGNIEIPYDSSMEIGTGDFAISFWIKTTQLPFGGGGFGPVIMHRQVGGSAFSKGWRVEIRRKPEAPINDLSVAFHTYDENGFESGIVLHDDKKINDGSWHHVLIGRGQNPQNPSVDALGIIVDGVGQPVNIDQDWDFTPFAGSLFIGATTNGDRSFIGTLDEVAMLKPINGLLGDPRDVAEVIYNSGEGVELEKCFPITASFLFGSTASQTDESDLPDSIQYQLETAWDFGVYMGSSMYVHLDTLEVTTNNEATNGRPQIQPYTSGTGTPEFNPHIYLERTGPYQITIQHLYKKFPTGGIPIGVLPIDNVVGGLQLYRANVMSVSSSNPSIVVVNSDTTVQWSGSLTSSQPLEGFNIVIDWEPTGSEL